MKFHSRENEVFWKSFDGVSRLAGNWRRYHRPRLRASVWVPSGAPFSLQEGSFGSTRQEEEAGGVSLHRRCAVAGEDDRRVLVTRESSRATTHLRRVRARGWSKNFGKNVEKSGKLFYRVCAISFLIWPSRCLSFRTDQPRFA